MNPPKDKITKSLRFSLLDGVFAAGMVGFTQDFLVPFLLLLGGTSRHVGVMSSLPNLLAALVQLKSADLSEKLGSRRRVITFFVFLQAVVLIPMALMAWHQSVAPMAFIIVVAIFGASGAFVLPAWGSLMSDLVPDNKRGEYFGWRNRILGFIVVGATFAAGIILHISEHWGGPAGRPSVFAGFVIIFSLACVFRLFSWYFLTRMHEPPLEYKKEHHFTLYDFLARTKESNFVRFVFFVSLMNFSVNMAAPFFAVFMLRDLRLNYLTYTILNVTVAITVYMLMGRWGRHADKVGNLAVMKATAPIIAILPLLWIINQHTALLILYQIVSGFAWAGFNLSASNFIYDAVIPEKRTRCISYFNVINGLALCLGALAGGLLTTLLPQVSGGAFGQTPLLTLFLISSILRLFISFLAPRGIKEVRAVQKVDNNRLLLSMIGVKSLC